MFAVWVEVSQTDATLNGTTESESTNSVISFCQSDQAVEDPPKLHGLRKDCCTSSKGATFACKFQKESTLAGE